MQREFEIAFLDHVAIRVMDIEKSALWYESVLGLKKYKLEKWGAFPIFMMAGKCGVALFPADSHRKDINANSTHVAIDHFAFNVTSINYIKAKEKLAFLNIVFEEKDHFYFHSIYMKDPDGHTVELTTLVIDEEDFYT